MAATDLTQAQLFVDDAWIADSLRVGRVFHQARKYPEPVLRADRPWEEQGVVLYGTVLKREGRFQMWYLGWTRKSPYGICYAESVDGVHWEKPSLGLHEFEGSTENNICLMAGEGGYIDCISVIDDAEDAEWPLKAVVWQRANNRSGLHGVRSKDGRVWEWTPGSILPNWGDRTNAMARREDGKYVIFGRPPQMLATHGCRIVIRTESEDFVHWSEPELILKPDVEDDPRLQFYSATPFRYESLYLGFIERMYSSPDKLDSELIHSRDGVQWSRTRTRPRFIEWGPEGTWDGTWLSMGSAGPIFEESRLWFYYSGRSGAHSVPFPLNHGAIGLAVLRPDGFASLQALDTPGWVETPPFEWSGGDLLVNVDPRRDITAHPSWGKGELRVEVRGESGRPLKGYGVEDCLPMTRNTSRGHGAPVPYEAVQWAEQPRGMKKHKGKRVRLVFHLRDAHLYAFKAG